MKKLFSLLLLTVSTCLITSAQKINETKVPFATKSAFMKANPNVKGEWEMEDGNYEVNYKTGGKTMSAVINKAGTILEIETELVTNELPQTVQSYIAQHYKGARTNGAAKIVNASGEINYEVKINGKEMMFDTNGKMMKKGKEEKDDEENEGKEHKGHNKRKD